MEEGTPTIINSDARNYYYIGEGGGGCCPIREMVHLTVRVQYIFVYKKGEN